MYQTPSQEGRGTKDEIQLVDQEKLPPAKPNITPEEIKAIKEHKEDHSHVVLIAEKGMAMVVMDREDYMTKAQSLLADTTYKTITRDPANKLKNKLSQTLRDIKNQGGLGDYKYRKVYPTSVVGPKFYGLPNIHEVGTPLCPLCLVGDPSHLGWPRSGPTLLVLWLASPDTISKTPNTLYNTSRR